MRAQGKEDQILVQGDVRAAIGVNQQSSRDKSSRSMDKMVPGDGKEDHMD